MSINDERAAETARLAEYNRGRVGDRIQEYAKRALLSERERSVLLEMVLGDVAA